MSSPSPYRPSARPRLKGREAEVAKMAAEGLTDTETAERLGIKTATVNSYWKRILVRLRARSRTHAVAILAEHEARDLRRELAELRFRGERRPPGFPEPHLIL